jgi:hypothetical protein
MEDVNTTFRVKPLVVAVLYAIAEKRFGPAAGLYPLDFHPWRPTRVLL